MLPEMHSGGTGLVAFFCGTILAWVGTSSGLGGAQPRNAPRIAGPVVKYVVRIATIKTYSSTIHGSFSFVLLKSKQ